MTAVIELEIIRSMQALLTGAECGVAGIIIIIIVIIFFIIIIINRSYGSFPHSLRLAPVSLGVK